MKKMKKWYVITIIITLLLTPIINAQQIVEVQQPTTEKKGLFSGIFSILKSPIVWGIIIFLVLAIALLIGIFFLVRWAIKFIKSRNDIFFRMRIERLKLARIHRRYNSKAWFKITKNTPIRLIREHNGKPHISNPIAYHRGDFTTHEGNIIISMNLIGDNTLFVFPKTTLLVIPNKEEIKIPTKNPKSEREITKIKNLPLAKDIIQFNENEILIYAESISNTGIFYIPVLKSKEGKIIDLSMPVYETLKQVVISDYLYEQTDEFSKLAKKSMDINPNLRYDMKSRDNSQSVDIPQNS